MMVKNKTNKNYKRSQKGRSMVEMLGVLAIVGVLSVGGVYGYGVAMKKHKANELLHQASMLATTISAQAMTNDGNLPQTLTSFGNSSYGTFSPSTTEALDGKGFSITIENVDSAVCDQLKKGGIIQGIECKAGSSEGKKNAEITYYKNLATDPAEGEKSPTGGSGTEKDPACEGVECPEGTTCGVAGNCIAEKTTDGTCSKNADCDDWCETNGGGEKCYCAINADFLEDDSACYNNFTGQCAVATTKSLDTDEYTVSADYISWWSAVNFCKAHNKSLVSLADLGITDGYQDYAYCEGSECGTVNWSDLKDKLGSDYYWVTDAVSCDLLTGECTSGANNNSCSAFYVNLSSGAVFYNDRLNHYYYSALCE